MFTYAIGNIVSGSLGDAYYQGKNILSVGLLGSGLTLCGFVSVLWLSSTSTGDGVVPLIGAHVRNGLLLVAYGLFGLFQSTGGPVGELSL